MLLDETCFFLAIDLDGDGWQSDAVALRETCQRFDLPFALERSRSGKGAHLWLFFHQAIPASTARNLGSYLLTEAMEHRPQLGLASYDRLFPNEDMMPKCGFGYLISMPLQNGLREVVDQFIFDGTMQRS